MLWQKQLIQQVEEDQAAQISIDGAIYTVSRTGKEVTFTNPYRESRTFPSAEAVVHHLESNLEHPIIVVL